MFGTHTIDDDGQADLPTTNSRNPWPLLSFYLPPNTCTASSMSLQRREEQKAQEGAKGKTGGR